MKFTQYQPAIQPTTIGGGANKAPELGAAYGYTDPKTTVDARNAKQWATAMDTVAKVAVKKQGEQDAMDLLDLQNKVNTELQNRLYNPEDGLFTTALGENAKGLTDRTAEAIKETTDKYIGDYNGRVQQAFQKTYADNVQSYMKTAFTQMATEKNKIDELNLAAYLSNNTDLADYHINNSIANSVNKNNAAIEVFGISKGWSSDIIVSKKREFTSKLVNDQAQMALEAGDTTKAREIANDFRTELDNKTWRDLDSAIKKKEVKIELDDFLKNLPRKGNGRIDKAAAYQDAERKWGKDAGHWEGGGSGSKYNPANYHNYVVDSSAESYSVDSGDLDPELQRRLGMTAQEYYEKTGRKLWVTATTGGGHTAGSAHYSGKAVDFVSFYWENDDNAADPWLDESAREEFKAIGAKNGLIFNDEYVADNQVAETSGVHLHAMINPNVEAPSDSVGGRRWKSDYNPDELDRAKNKIDAMDNDEEREINKQKKENVDSIRKQILHASSETEALELIEANSDTLDGSDEASLLGTVHTKFPKNAGSKTNANGLTTVQQNQLDAAEQNIEARGLDIYNNDKKPTSNEWTNLRLATLKTIDMDSNLAEKYRTLNSYVYADSEDDPKSGKNTFTGMLEDNQYKLAYDHIYGLCDDDWTEQEKRMVCSMVFGMVHPDYMIHDTK